MSLPHRYDVFGTNISLTTGDEVVSELLRDRPSGLMVVIANVHSVMTTRRNRDLARVLDDADIVTPDGMPLVWALRANGHDAVRVTGIEVMRKCIDEGRSSRARHFFYGSTDEVLAAMVASLTAAYPGFEAAGTLSPPFRELTIDDLEEHARVIRESRADVVWVGLGMPKQERWMGQMRGHLPGVALVGVGAAFDWVAGTAPVAPKWMQERGLEWLFRLVVEPRRLWKRYIYNNPAFLILLIRRLLTNKLGRASNERPRSG